jgi:hypothetical protein
VANTSASIGETELYYLTEVLGLRSILLPLMQVPFVSALAPATSAGTSRIRGDLGASSLLCVFAGLDELPLQGDAEDLAGKMIQAMKLSSRDVVWLEWSGHETAPEAIRDVALSAGFRPILCFGQNSAEGLMGLGAASGSMTSLLGQFSEWHGLKIMTTFSLAELMANPAHKKQAWSHLQKVMKVLE